MIIKYRKQFSHAQLLERFNEDGKGREYVLTNCEDATIYPIQAAGRPSLIRTGIILDGVENEIVVASLLSSITRNTGLILVNPMLSAGKNEELVLCIANLARSVQTISKGAMIAKISILGEPGAEFVEAIAPKPTPTPRKRTRTRKED